MNHDKICYMASTFNFKKNLSKTKQYFRKSSLNFFDRLQVLIYNGI